MRILFDVNVFEDIFRANPGWPVCQELVDAAAEGEIEGWILANTVHILHYFHRKRVGERQARSDVRDMLKGFAVLPLRAGVIKGAWEAATPDFEDNLQIEGARGFGLDGIVTRNKRDFRSGPVPAYTPEELLSLVERVPSSVAGIPFVDLKAQHHTIYNDMDDEIADLIANTAFIGGPRVKAFEEKFAVYQGARFCVGTSSGTDSLHLILWALGIGPGDEVMVPVNTFIATAEAVSLTGARPVFVDHDPVTYTMDPVQAEEVLRTHPHVKAILPVHLYGHPVDMDPILELAEKHGLAVVEDACQAHGAEYKGKRVGVLGVAGAFSFYPGKNLGACGEAGAVVTDDEEFYRKVALLHDHGSSKRYHHEVPGHNYRMSAMQAAVLNVKLPHLERWTEARRRNAALYREAFQEIPEVAVPKEAPWGRHVVHLFVIRVPRRDALRTVLEDQGIATGLHYPIPLHLQAAYRDLGYRRGEFPVAEAYMDQLLSLPMYAELREAQIRRVAEAIRAFFR